MKKENEFTQTSWKFKRSFLWWNSPQPEKKMKAGNFNFELYLDYLEAIRKQPHQN